MPLSPGKQHIRVKRGDRGDKRVRCWIGLLMLSAAGLASPAAMGMDGIPATAADERLAIPYSCTVENGAVVTRPGPERTLEVIGERQQRLITTCDPPFSNNCRSITVHRFDVACGTERVPWQRVVASIGRTTAGAATMTKGHMVLAREASVTSGHVPSCADRKPAAGASVSGECLPWRVQRPTEQVVLPQGFAPLREVGARIVDGKSPSEWTAAQLMAAGGPLPVAAMPLAGPDPDPLTATAGRAWPQEVTLREITDPPAQPDTGWTTSLSVYRGEEPPAELIMSGAPEAPVSTASSLSFGPWLALITCLGLAGAILARTDQLRLAAPLVSLVMAGATRSARRARGLAAGALDDVRGRLAARPDASREVEDPALASALLQLEAMLARTEAAVSMLSNAMVLREVMQGELAVIRERLTETREAARAGSVPLMKLAAQLRHIAREIDRVQRITESASQSFSSRPQGGSVPATVGEAYAVFGVAADVGDLELKRIVDAHRVRWHPDRADGEADRVEREVRMKQINVAWDLLSARRPGA